MRLSREEVEGVGVMKDEEVKLDETEACHIDGTILHGKYV